MSFRPFQAFRGFGGGAALSFDADAADYFSRIVAAGSTISAGNQAAVNAFVVGCKADGIWSAIKAGCILAGADTLAGALVPLVGSAPTSSGFVIADYSRTAGLKGNGTSKFLNSNRNNDADPQDSHHLSCYVTTLPTTVGTQINGGNNLAGASGIADNGVTRSRNGSSLTNTTSSGLRGLSRSSSTSYSVRFSGSTSTKTQASQSPASSVITVFSWPGSSFSDARMSFYSIGESLNLALLDARLSTLMAALT